VISHLRIKNLALLDAVALDLPREFVAITGETGAGKSVLVGALKFLAGARAEKSVIREGADSCEVEAALHFKDARAVDKMLERLGLPFCEEGQMIVFRSLSATKPSKITINGQMASLSTLQNLGAQWLEYNSPEAVLELYNPAEQLSLLDRFGKVDTSGYDAAFKTYQAAKEKLQTAKTSERLSGDEIDFLGTQLEKIDNLRLSAESVDSLEAEYKRLSNIEHEMETANSVVDAFSQAKRLQVVVARARNLGAENAAYKNLVERLESLVIEIDDQESSWRQTAGKSDMTLAERERIQERMGEWMELKRRHLSLEGVMRYRETLADKLQLQQNIEALLEQYERECQTALQLAAFEQQKLIKVRRAAAQTLINEALPLLKKLGLPKAELEGRFTPTEPSPNGGCDFELLFNANPGQSIKPLAQIASSGELARVMLALKTVLIKASSKSVIVFDEVDANVGGEVATAVAELLARLGESQQVFCITHLPQVAARANFHLVVRKSASKNSTAVTIEAIADSRKRLEELARMLGDRNAATALEHAKVLLGK
jgi:DNA repair protein RecN (Recombination protein N)